MTLEDKILGSLAYTSFGDAMGAATENLPFDVIREQFNGPVTTFLKPGKTAFALGNEAGGVTDDFSQTYLVCESILDHNREITTEAVKAAILKWADMPQFFNRFAGPTTRTAVAMYRDPSAKMKPLPGAVVVDYASKATNGAAMKISPAGLFNPGDLDSAISAAVTIAKVTHDNSLSISGACAVAASVSAAVGDAENLDEIIDAGLYGARRGEELGRKESHYVAGPSVIERTKLAVEIAEGPESKERKLEKLYQIIGSGLHISEAVPCAYGLIKLNENDPYQAVIDAVNIGYDTDTIAAITGSMVGAFAVHDQKFCDMLATVESVNGLHIRKLASEIAK